MKTVSYRTARNLVASDKFEMVNTGTACIDKMELFDAIHSCTVNYFISQAGDKMYKKVMLGLCLIAKIKN